MVGLGEYNIHESICWKCTYPDHIIKRLRALGVEIITVAHKIDVQEKGSQIVDGYILREILPWKNLGLPPSTVVLISFDNGYISHLLKLKWFEEVLDKDLFVHLRDHCLPLYGCDYNFRVATPLVSTHPSQHSVAVVVGYDLRVFALRASP